MKIWAHMLVKNEARWLWYSVASIAPYVDKVLLWDTGSTDKSLDVIKSLLDYFPGRIDFKKRPQSSAFDFAEVRQEMLDVTQSDWFLTVDGDEIWWKDSIGKLVSHINKVKTEKESVIVPTYNLVGDIFHYQDKSSGKYNFGKYSGHYNLRAVNRNIPGLKSLGKHGVWGWADEDSKMIQDRGADKMDFVDAPYLHATNLLRSTNQQGDNEVVKRKGKLKYEIGLPFPKDFYYPEVLFESHPEFIYSPWQTMDGSFKTRAYLETPLRRLKRKIFKGKVGY